MTATPQTTTPPAEQPRPFMHRLLAGERPMDPAVDVTAFIRDADPDKPEAITDRAVVVFCLAGFELRLRPTAEELFDLADVLTHMACWLDKKDMSGVEYALEAIDRLEAQKPAPTVLGGA